MSGRKDKGKPAKQKPTKRKPTKRPRAEDGQDAGQDAGTKKQKGAEKYRRKGPEGQANADFTKYKPRKDGEAPNENDARTKRFGKSIVTSDERAAAATELNKLTGSILQKHTRGEDKSAVVKEMYGKIEGKVMRYAFRHDMARAIQTCFRFVSGSERDVILEELSGKMLELSKNVYSSKTVIAFLRYGNEKQRVKILNEFRNQMIRLSTHSCASTVLDFAFLNCNVDHAKTKRGKAQGKKERKEGESTSLVSASSVLTKLRLELYGAEMAVFASDVDRKRDPKTMFHSLDLAKKRKSLEQLNAIVTKQAEKGILRFGFAHTLMRDLITLCEQNMARLDADKSEEAKEDDGEKAKRPEAKILQGLIPLVTEALLAMISSADGAAAVARCIAHAGAKDRKKMVKIIKSHAANLLFHDYGYIVIAALVTAVDDTVLLNKSLISEINSDDVAASVLQLTLGNAIARAQTMPMSSEASQDEHGDNNDDEQVGDQEGQEDQEMKDTISKAQTHQQKLDTVSQVRSVFLQILAPTSTRRYLTKKDADLIQPAPGTSRKDPAQRGKELATSLLPPLSHACVGHVGEMLANQRAADLLVEIIQTSWPEALLNEVVQETTSTSLEDAVSHRAIKRIIAADSSNEARRKAGEDDFIFAMLAKVEKNLVKLVKVNRACFVLASLLEHPAVQHKLKGALKKHAKTIKAGDSAGAKVLAKLLK